MIDDEPKRGRGRPRNPVADKGPPKSAGRPKGSTIAKVIDRQMTVREYAMTHVFKAIDVWGDIMNDVEAPHAARVSAAAHVVNRAVGQPAVADATLRDTSDQTLTRIERIVIDVPKKEAILVKGIARAKA